MDGAAPSPSPTATPPCWVRPAVSMDADTSTARMSATPAARRGGTRAPVPDPTSSARGPVVAVDPAHAGAAAATMRCKRWGGESVRGEGVAVVDGLEAPHRRACPARHRLEKWLGRAGGKAACSRSAAPCNAMPLSFPPHTTRHTHLHHLGRLRLQKAEGGSLVEQVGLQRIVQGAGGGDVIIDGRRRRRRPRRRGCNGGPKAADNGSRRRPGAADASGQDPTT